MSGPAEDALSAEHSQMVADLREIVGWSRPRYGTSSGFLYVYDASAGGDNADVSALAQEMSVLIAAVTARPLQPPGGPEPGTVQRSEEASASATTEVASVMNPDPKPGTSGPAPTETVAASAGPTPGAQAKTAVTTTAATETAATTAGTGTGTATATDVVPEVSDDALLPSVEALLSVPTSVAGRERAEQACRAMAKGWYEEAEQLFLAGAEVNPIDPFSWFGAGLSASHLDVNRAAAHLEKASRYLLTDDPSGAVYVAIAAAALYEIDHHQAAAERLLEQRLRELNRSCPAISMHLGRLGGARRARLSEAISIDPMLQADLIALDLCPTESLVADRRRQTEREIAQVNDAIRALRHDPSKESPSSDAGSQTGPSFDGKKLSLVEAEVELWRQIEECEEQIDRALQTMENKERDRRQTEKTLEREAMVADGDLDPQATSQFFAVSLLIAVAIMFLFVIGNALTRSYPFFGGVIGFLTWIGVMGLVWLEIQAFVTAWWPSRRFEEARSAKVDLLSLEWQVTEERTAEFLFRRHYFEERDKAEKLVGEILDKRDGLVPRRPVFLADDLPLVPARNSATR